jgi:hypothetical protein
VWIAIFLGAVEAIRLLGAIRDHLDIVVNLGFLP